MPSRGQARSRRSRYPIGRVMECHGGACRPMERPIWRQRSRPEKAATYPASALARSHSHCWCGPSVELLCEDPACRLQVLETFHPPTYYLPARTAVCTDWLEPVAGAQLCEMERLAHYFDIWWWKRKRIKRALWHYPEANSRLRGPGPAGMPSIQPDGTAADVDGGGLRPSKGPSMAAGSPAPFSGPFQGEIRSTRGNVIWRRQGVSMGLGGRLAALGADYSIPKPPSTVQNLCFRPVGLQMTKSSKAPFMFSPRFLAI